MTADSAAPRTLAYVACAGDDVVGTFEFDGAEGTLRRAGEPAPAPKVRALAAAPDGTRLYAALSFTPGRTAAYDVGPDGSLSPAGEGDVPAPQCYVSIDATGRHVFGATYHGHQVTRSTLDADGHFPRPQQHDGPQKPDAQQQVLEPGLRAHAVLPSPDNAFVYATALGSDRIAVYALDGAAGTLSPASATDSAPDSGPRHLRFSADGDRLYVLHEMSGEVAVYGRDSRSGALAELQRISTVPASLGLVHGRMREPGVPDPGPDAIWCADLRLSRDGRYLYTSERSSSTISILAVDGQDGTLRLLGTVPTEQQPRGIAVDPSGRYLLAAGELSGAVTVHRIGDDGGLTAVSRTEVGAGPLWIEFLQLPRS